ncbi:MAG: formate dehydrogenase accessory sulfurtransferase FdhD [Planctomycetota bacterium]
MSPDRARVPSDQGEAWVVEEAPLLIEVGEERVLTFRTPGHDEELALGFLVAEGILRRAADVERIELSPPGEQAAVARARAVLAPGAQLGPVARERLSRAHAVRPSCGLCGLTSAEGLTRDLPELAPGRPRTSIAALAAMERAMRARQDLFQATGGCHAAGAFDAASGEVWAVREDVGRHNALDKALGACLAAGKELSAAAVVLSGRAGYELVLKALRLGVPIVASVSAPSRLAVELAAERGQTLVAFLRDGAGRVFWDEGRLAAPG